MVRLVTGLTRPPVAARSVAPVPSASSGAGTDRSVPTSAAAWSRWDCAQVAANPTPNVAHAVASTTRNAAAAPCGRRATPQAASGRVSERDDAGARVGAAGEQRERAQDERRARQQAQHRARRRAPGRP